MNEDVADVDQNKGNDSSDNEHEDKRMNALQDRRKRYYEERKKRMNKNKTPASISDILNSEEKTIEPETRFLNIKVHTKISVNAYSTKAETEIEMIPLVGEIEIADYITFQELAPKSLSMFNDQLKDKGHDIELLVDQSKKC
jgi:hypothetical protein